MLKIESLTVKKDYCIIEYSGLFMETEKKDVKDYVLNTYKDVKVINFKKVN